LDILLWLAGAPAVEIAAFTENAGLPVESFINVQARLANDILLSMTFADAVPQGLLSDDQHLMIVGEQGLITDDSGTASEQGLERPLWLHRDGQRHKLETELPDTTLDAAFVETILDGKSNLSPANEGAYIIEFIEALYRSAAQGCIVRLPKR
jgi:predicted dehydrogenase